jgi:3',5'-cyclic-AMP phosphodiesterase
MSQTIRIAQISDTHIGPTADYSNGVDTRAHFCMVMNDVLSQDIDLVVLSGDLALENGEPDAYSWIVGEMAKYPILYEVISGNHDRVTALAHSFALQENVHEGELYYKVEFNGKTMLFMDSTVGVVSRKQLEWMKRQAHTAKGDVIIFVHHPIVKANCLFMDSKYALQNIDEVHNAVASLSNVHHIFTGHYHTEKSIDIGGGQTLYITPSTQIQISETNPEFEISSSVPGWRLIEWDGQSLTTSVRYVNS